MPKKKNRRKPKPSATRNRPVPPAAAAAYARAYRCTDCNSETELVSDPAVPGLWTLKVFHDDGCPVLTGQVPKTGAALTALADVPGTSMYVDLDPPEGA